MQGKSAAPAAVDGGVEYCAMDRFDLGSHTRPISTASEEAQRWFDLGLNWCFGFNQEEGVKCFRKALEADPGCVMAHWGIAYGSGPFYNYPWRHFGERELRERVKLCHHHIRQARALAGNATEVEKALIDAMAARVPAPDPPAPDVLDTWDDAYRDAMRTVHHRYPDDQDAMALFVEALITRTPWRLWDVKTGLPAVGADTLEALDVCDRSIRLAESLGREPHPGVLHLHIHTLEMSDHPERAMASADRLATMCPDAGHLNHMPGHIYVLCGEYEKARQASLMAMAADDKYVAYAGKFNFYTTARCHDLHLMMYTCMLMGRYQDALEAADQICETLTPDVLGVEGVPQLVATLEGYFSMRMHVLVRFGRWQDIITAPMPVDPELYCVSTAMHHYAKGVAHAALKEFDAAEAQLGAFHRAVATIPESRKFFNNAAVNVLGVGEKMLEGELAYHRGSFDEAFAHLREAVQRDDDLEYTEPWAWMHPPRHALAALLAEQGSYDEAEALYREDLGMEPSLQRCAQHPGNVWALHGLVECLRARGESDELPDLERQLASAQAMTDVAITSSCMCRGHEDGPTPVAFLGRRDRD